MKRGTPDHPKTLMLAERLALPPYAAAGALECLFHWTAKYAPRGDVGRYSDAIISRGVGWDRSPDELISALVSTGWLDESDEHRLLVHDWHDHAEDAVRKALERSGETFATGARPRRDRVETLSRQNRDAVTPALPLPLPLPQPQPCQASASALPGECRGGAPAGAPTPQPPEKRKRIRERLPVEPAPDALTEEQRAALEAWCEGACPALLPELPRIAAKVLDWGRGKGVCRADWPATIRNAVREEAERRGIYRPPPPPPPRPPAARVNEKPQERGPRTHGGMQPLFGG